MKIVPAGQRHFTDFGWLESYWLFSFGNYYDPQNVQHGKLRVFNDDVVKPQSGFAKHPHEEMEIVSIVLTGEMVHKDTMGNTLSIKAGEVQRMTAGTGLFHSEWNTGDTPIHFLQIWLSPDRKELAPSYDQKTFHFDIWQNRLALLASGKKEKDVVSLNTDGSIYRSVLSDGSHMIYTPGKERKTFLYVVDGRLLLNGLRLEKGDQARIADDKKLEMYTTDQADIILIDVPV